MTHPSLNFLVPGIGPAGLPLPLTAVALPELDKPDSRSVASETERAYSASDPGSIEFESWAAYLRHSVR